MPLSREIADGIAELLGGDSASTATRARADELALSAFSIATQSLLLGAEDVGRLALACERALDHFVGGSLGGDSLPLLAASAHTLAQAFDALAHPDQSGARTEGVPVEAARHELEATLTGAGAPRAGAAADVVPASALTRRPATRSRPAPEPEAQPEPAPAPAVRGETWIPTVDEDMIDLFFEEANDRIEALSGKLLEIEQRPGDAELLRDVFRDLHTLKGSSAMVGLDAMNRLAHSAEDLVGQLRDRTRGADGAVVDVLLATLDALRDIAGRARRRESLAIDLAPLLARLRDPSASPGTGAVAPATPAAGGPAPGPASAGGAAGAAPATRPTIRVDFDKLDKLMNLVGELVLGRDGLHAAIGSLAALGAELSSERQLSRHVHAAARSFQISAGGGRARAHGTLHEIGDELSRVERVVVDIATDLDTSSGRLEAVSDDLRDSVMKLRMIQVGGVLRKHQRTVRDLAQSLGKRVRLILHGEDTELDKLLVEALDEPLMHLVRNAVDHAIEMPDVRARAGKPEEGTIELSARHRGNQVHIEIRDDGRGIDPAFVRERALARNIATAEELATMDDRQALDLIFRAGFSTAEVVSEISGRGVGMDVVRQAIVTRLKGSIDLSSSVGEGTVLTLRLPLTLAIMQVLLARTGGEVFAIPLDSVLRTITCRPGEVDRIQHREVLAVRGRQVPLIRLAHVLELDTQHDPGHGPDDDLHVVLSEVGGESYGLVCETLLGKKEIVIKPLGDVLKNVPCAAGATLLGDRCALILDVPQVVARALRGTGAHAPAPRPAGDAAAAPAPAAAPHVLLVEDSDVTRESLRRLIVEAGYRCTTARDGIEGLELAQAETFDLVSTDVMMPRMDGYELTRALRQTAAYRNVPIVMVTSRGERIDRVRGFDAGVDEYITKPHDRHMLLRAIAKLIAGRRSDEEAT